MLTHYSMFVCSPTSCPGVVNVDIDQNHQLWRSLPGSTINEVWTCQLNPVQREEANVCFNFTASAQEGLGSGLTPGWGAVPEHTHSRTNLRKCQEEVWNPQRCLKGGRVSLLENLFSDIFLSHRVASGQSEREWRGVMCMVRLLPADGWWTKVRLAAGCSCELMPSHVAQVWGCNVWAVNDIPKGLSESIFSSSKTKEGKAENTPATHFSLVASDAGPFKIHGNIVIPMQTFLNSPCSPVAWYKICTCGVSGEIFTFYYIRLIMKSTNKQISLVVLLYALIMSLFFCYWV